MKGSDVLKEAPDHHDADLVLKIYDLRREAVMRESRTAMNTKFWPRSADEAVAVTKNDHPLNLAYRQTTAYWEMVYSMARHGIVHPDFLVENNTEGLFLFARVEPYLERIRQAASPRSFRNTEWVATNTGAGIQLMEGFRARVKQIQSSS
jgi:hypothetical protein